MKFILSFSVLTLLLTSCTQTPKQQPAFDRSAEKQESLEKFEEGNKLMDNQMYEKAVVVFESARIETPATTLDSLILFNLALSYRNLGDCHKSYNTLRKVVNYSNQRAPELATRAKLKMAADLSCLGDDSKALVLLIETYKQRKHLPPAMGEAEVPAKIAALYARNGEKKMADQYLKVAEQGLIRMSANKELLAETLFLMGDFTQITEGQKSWPKFMSSYNIARKYLVRAILLNDEKWSVEALRALKSGIADLWSFESEYQAKQQNAVSAEEKREHAQDRYQLLKAMLGQVVRTKMLITPNKKPNTMQKDLEAYLNQEELKIRNALAATSIAPETTKEADKLDSLKRDGRMQK